MLHWHGSDMYETTLGNFGLMNNALMEGVERRVVPDSALKWSVKADLFARECMILTTPSFDVDFLPISSYNPDYC